MKFSFGAALSLFIFPAANAVESLMLRAQEVRTVILDRQQGDVADLYAHQLRTDAGARAQLQCNGIMYMGATQWTVWLNGQALSNDRHHPDYEIVKVTEESVKLIWKKGQAPLVVTLYPNTAYQQAENRQDPSLYAQVINREEIKDR